MTDTVATGVSHAELATLKRIALQGGRAGPVKISCSGLASELDVSNQTASRRLQALEETGLIDRDIVSDGQWVSVTEDGETQLRHEYEDYRRIFEEAATLKLNGVVTLGMGEGRHYISLPGYMEQFEEKLGYEPYAGTFNLVLTRESVRVRAAISSFDGIRIEGWEAEDRTYGPATCYPATLLFDGKSYEPAHVIIPDRTHHDENQLEIIAPDRLRDKLDVEDDDEVTVVVEDV